MSQKQDLVKVSPSLTAAVGMTHAVNTGADCPDQPENVGPLCLGLISRKGIALAIAQVAMRGK